MRCKRKRKSVWFKTCDNSRSKICWISCSSYTPEDTWPVKNETYGYLSNCAASLTSHWY